MITLSVCFIILSIIYQASTAAVALTTDAAAETGGVLYEHFEGKLSINELLKLLLNFEDN